MLPSELSNKVGSGEEEFFQTEGIRGKRTRKGQVEYLVKWEGCPESSNSWEPLSNLDQCELFISAFEEASKNLKKKDIYLKKISPGLKRSIQIAEAFQNTVNEAVPKGRKKKVKFSVCSSSVTGEDCNREANLSMFAQNIPSVLGDDEDQMSTSSKKSISFHQTGASVAELESMKKKFHTIVGLVLESEETHAEPSLVLHFQDVTAEGAVEWVQQFHLSIVKEVLPSALSAYLPSFLDLKGTNELASTRCPSV